MSAQTAAPSFMIYRGAVQGQSLSDNPQTKDLG